MGWPGLLDPSSLSRCAVPATVVAEIEGYLHHSIQAAQPNDLAFDHIVRRS